MLGNGTKMGTIPTSHFWKNPYRHDFIKTGVAISFMWDLKIVTAMTNESLGIIFVEISFSDPLMFSFCNLFYETDQL